MVGLVVVSHSYTLACGVVELAREMGGPDLRIEHAGGMDTPDHAMGTDPTLILDAIQRASGDDGVVVLMDLGSAVLSAEMALELLPPEVADRVTLCPAPIVEGAVAAAVAARLGQSADEVAAEANRGLAGKAAHLGGPPPPAAAPADAPAHTGPWTEDTITMRNRLGLHARPAALLVTALGGLDAEVQVGNATTGTPPVSARSLSAVATLGVLSGQDLLVRARGAGAQAAVSAVHQLAARNWGDDDTEAPPPVPAAEPQAPQAHGVITGLPGAPGLALGPVRQAHQPETPVPDRAATMPAEERAELDAALEASRAELMDLRSDIASRVGAGQSVIFDAHMLLLDDTELLDAVWHDIDAGRSAPVAWDARARALETRFAQLGDPYLAERAADVGDVRRRVLAHLAGVPVRAPVVNEPGILFAGDLAPGETAALDASVVHAIVTAAGGPTSHTAILARALGVPAVVGAGLGVMELPAGTMVLVDGTAGTLTVDPDAQQVAAYHAARGALERRRLAELEAAAAPAVTADGRRIEVAANIARPQDAAGLLRAGAEGVGLFRTEFLFMGRDTAPTEDEQLAAYRQVAEALDGRPLVVRTLDAGADKPVPYLNQAPEANPFLGERGVRLTLARPELMRTQLRAILRAAAEHPVRIMFPMIATLEEFRRARAHVEEVRGELAAQGVRVRDDLQVGLMVEVPAAALCAATLAGEADFFSVGTNDLTQYTMAAERGNPAVAGLNDPLHPGVLRLIQAACVAAEAAGAWVGVCGEAAADPVAIPILVGLGVRELSMSATAIPAAKAAVRALTMDVARARAAAAVGMGSAAEVRAAGA
ncbi:MAG: phosphoenolpyruvate--protein phosphotransferase [Thermoleophilia bacterium]